MGLIYSMGGVSVVSAQDGAAGGGAVPAVIE